MKPGLSCGKVKYLDMAGYFGTWRCARSRLRSIRSSSTTYQPRRIHHERCRCSFSTTTAAHQQARQAPYASGTSPTARSRRSLYVRLGRSVKRMATHVRREEELFDVLPLPRVPRGLQLRNASTTSWAWATQAAIGEEAVETSDEDDSELRRTQRQALKRELPWKSIPSADWPAFLGVPNFLFWHEAHLYFRDLGLPAFCRVRLMPGAVDQRRLQVGFLARRARHRSVDSNLHAACKVPLAVKAVPSWGRSLLYKLSAPVCG